jgi:uncharacterized membrane protein YeaQ/YmgE (transglycosylase-associated protein family)
MGISGIISAIVVGLIIGLLGRLVVRGKQRLGILVTILIGIAAAFLGAGVAKWLGVDNTRGIDWIELLFQIGFAAVLVALVSTRGRRRMIPRL